MSPYQLLTTSLLLGCKVTCPWKPARSGTRLYPRSHRELPGVKLSKGNDVEKARVVSDRRESNFQKCKKRSDQIETQKPGEWGDAIFSLLKGPPCPTLVWLCLPEPPAQLCPAGLGCQ